MSNTKSYTEILYERLLKLVYYVKYLLMICYLELQIQVTSY